MWPVGLVRPPQLRCRTRSSSRGPRSSGPFLVTGPFSKRPPYNERILFLHSRILVIILAWHLFLIANIVTSSKALVTSSDALVPSSLLFPFLLKTPSWSDSTTSLSPGVSHPWPRELEEQRCFQPNRTPPSRSSPDSPDPRGPRALRRSRTTHIHTFIN